MDPITGAVVAGLVAAALEKAGEKAVEHLTDDAIDASQGAIGRLVGWVRRRFAGRRELVRLEDAPDSARRIELLGEVIDAELVADEAARSEVAGLVAAVQAQQPEVFQSVVNSHHVIQAKDSTVTVTWADSSGPHASNG